MFPSIWTMITSFCISCRRLKIWIWRSFLSKVTSLLLWLEHINFTLFRTRRLRVRFRPISLFESSWPHFFVVFLFSFCFLKHINKLVTVVLNMICFVLVFERSSHSLNSLFLCLILLCFKCSILELSK